MSYTNDQRSCPLCNKRDREPFLEKGTLRLIRCRRCSMGYAESIAEEIASGDFYQRRPFYLSPEKLAGDYAPVRFERELKLFSAWCKSGAVLDVGCSTGAFLYQLQTRFPGAYEVLGTDVAGEALDYAESRGVPVRREPFLDSDWGTRRFDAVTFWAVLEHLAEPRAFLEQAAGLLRPGGHCFILVPNLQSLAVRLLGPKYRYIMAEHLNYFTAATSRDFVRKSGLFEIVAGSSTHFNPAVIWQDLRSRQREVADTERGRLLQRTTAWKQSPWAKPALLAYRGLERVLGALNLADNLVVVARRTS